MAADQIEVVHTDTYYEVLVTVTERTREVVVAKDYRHTVQEASQPQIITREVYSTQFTADDKTKAVKRAVNHLKIILVGDDE